MRRKAEYNGFGVTMPGDNQLDMSSPDLRDMQRRFSRTVPTV